MYPRDEQNSRLPNDQTIHLEFLVIRNWYVVPWFSKVLINS